MRPIRTTGDGACPYRYHSAESYNADGHTLSASLPGQGPIPTAGTARRAPTENRLIHKAVVMMTWRLSILFACPTLLIILI